MTAVPWVLGVFTILTGEPYTCCSRCRRYNELSSRCLMTARRVSFLTGCLSTVHINLICWSVLVFICQHAAPLQRGGGEAGAALGGLMFWPHQWNAPDVTQLLFQSRCGHELWQLRSAPWGDLAVTFHVLSPSLPSCCVSCDICWQMSFLSACFHPVTDFSRKSKTFLIFSVSLFYSAAHQQGATQMFWLNWGASADVCNLYFAVTGYDVVKVRSGSIQLHSAGGAPTW